MSCTVMYQPYAMSYSSSCDRASTGTSSDKKLFKLTQAPSPPDSLASETSSYNSPDTGPMSVGTTPSSHSSAASNSQSSSRRPLTPISTIVPGRSSSSSGGASASATSASAGRSSSLTESHSQSHEEPSTSHHHHHSHPHSSSLAIAGPSTSSHHSHSHSHLGHSSSSHHHRTAQYLSANSVVFVNYNGDVSRVVDEHFSRALSAAYATDKSSSKGLPMSTRNFPPSFWNSNYQPSKPLASYGASAADFYGAAVEYGASIPSLAHHHQTDPWHYPLPPPHPQTYHRPTEIPYPPMPSSSRFNAAAQYGSFLLAGAASSGAGRFPVIPGSSQCNVKSDGGWTPGRYHHHHDSLSDLHLADYSAAAAAAHYSNMTAGLESTVQDSSKDLYWF